MNIWASKWLNDPPAGVTPPSASNQQPETAAPAAESSISVETNPVTSVVAAPQTVPAVQILPPSTPVPTASAKPQHLLDKLSGWFKNKFVPVAKVAEKDAVIAAEVAEPFIDVAVPGIAGLYHTTLQLVIQAQAAADGASGVGAAKMASVVSAIEPLAIPYLKSLGVSAPTTAQIEAYVQSVLDGLKIFTTETAPAVA